MTKSKAERRLFLDNLWRDLAGLPEKWPGQQPPLELLRLTEWSPEFERLCRNRLLMGRFRHGPFGEMNAKSAGDILATMRLKIRRFRETLDLECLVDTANAAQVLFAYYRRRGVPWQSVDDGMHFPT